jgi:hypothetical protein
MPVAKIVFPHPPDAVAVAQSSEGGRLAVERVSPGDWLQVGRRLFGGGQVPVGVALPSVSSAEVVVFLAPEGFDALDWDTGEVFALCAARSGVALAVQPEPSPAALVLMDDEVRALAAGANLIIGEAIDERRPAQLDRAAAVPLPLARVRGVVEAIDLL